MICMMGMFIQECVDVLICVYMLLKCVFTCVCMCLYIYIYCKGIHIYVSANECLYVCMTEYLFENECECICKCMFACVCVSRVCIRVCACAWV